MLDENIGKATAQGMPDSCFSIFLVLQETHGALFALNFIAEFGDLIDATLQGQRFGWEPDGSRELLYAKPFS